MKFSRDVSLRQYLFVSFKTKLGLIGFKSNRKKAEYYFDWQGNKVRLRVYHEHRKNSRVSISRGGVNVRLPILLPEFEKKRLIDQFIQWAKIQLDEKPHFHFDKYKKYTSGEILQLYDEDFKILLNEDSNNLKGRIQVQEQAFVLSLPPNLSQEAYHQIISKLIHKQIAKLYKEKIWSWLQELNQRYEFGTLNGLRMKNNRSNWGSCSNKGNINISVRLLLAPKEVVEYVLIHELAHLKEQNHGVNFWKIVKQACPSYKSHEIWLKQNAKNCII